MVVHESAGEDGEGAQMCHVDDRRGDSRRRRRFEIVVVVVVVVVALASTVAEARLDLGPLHVRAVVGHGVRISDVAIVK